MAERAPSAEELLAHTDWLMQLARALVGDAAAADVVQDTYEVALTQPPRRDGPLRPWLGGVARNLARMTTRGRVRREKREIATAIDAETTSVPSPAQLVERAQMHQQVARLVLELPEPWRSTLLLRFFEGLSSAEIARAQGVPDATVRGRIKDALDRVRASLDREHGSRKQWALLLSPLPGVAARGATTTVVGGLVVKSTTKIGIAVVVIVLAVLGTRWLGWWGGGSSSTGAVAASSGSGSGSNPGAPQVVKSARSSSSVPARHQLPIFDDDPKGGLRLEGQVIDSGDAPVANARVAIDAHPTRVIDTDASGSFVFEGLMPRDYRLEATGGDGYAGPVRLRLTDKSEPVTLRMKPAGTVDVAVTGDGGKPVAGAEVELRSTLTWRATTDAKGMVQLHGVGSVWAPLAVHAGGFAPAAIMLSTSGDPAVPAHVAISLARGAPIAGRVVDAAGKPVANARVVATSASEPFPVVDPRRDGVVTGADGAFAFPTLSAGTWRLTASDPGHGPATSPPLVVDGVHPRTGVELVVTDGGVVRGKVVDTNGRPVEAAEVRVVARGHVDWRARRQALTGNDGAFEIRGLPLRAMDVVASHDTGASAIVPADLTATREIELMLKLDVTGEIVGIVVDKAHQPIGDAQVYAEPEWTGNVEQRETWNVRGFGEAVTDQGGKFKLTALPDGAYRLRATRPGASDAAMSLATPVSARPGGGQVELVVPGDGRIVGKIALADGNAPVRFTIEVGDFERPFAGAAGAFAMPVPAGTHAIVISGPGFVSKTVRDVAVTEDKDTDVGTISVAAGRSISGRVLDGQGAPVAKAKVAAGNLLTGGGKELYIADESIGAKDTETDDDGRFSLDGFGPNPITVVAGRDGAGRSPSLRIPPGPDSVTLDLVLQPTTGLEGKILRAGKPAGDVVIIANPIGATASNFFTTTGPDGTFALDALAPGPYIVYPMFGGGGPKPKDMYIRRVEVTAGVRSKVEIDATPGPLTLTIDVKGAGGTPAMAQVLVIEAAVDAPTLDDLRDGSRLPFGDAIIPIYLRGAMGGPVEIVGARPGVHTACAIAMGPGDPNAAPMKCTQVKLDAGTPKKSITLQLPKPKP